MTSRTSKRTEPRVTGGATAPDRGAAPGFTLLELLLVVALVGLVLGLTLPRVDAVRDAFLCDEDARSIAVLLRSARHDAVTRRATTAVSIARDEVRTLELRIVEGSTWPDEDPGIGAAACVAHIDDAPVRRVEVSHRIDLVAAEDQILFYADGRSSGGDVAVVDDRDRVLHRLRVDASTAHVLIEASGVRP